MIKNKYPKEYFLFRRRCFYVFHRPVLFQESRQMIITVPQPSFSLEAADVAPVSEETEPLYVAQNTYSDYYDQYSGENRPDAEILTWILRITAPAENGDFSVGEYG